MSDSDKVPKPSDLSAMSYADREAMQERIHAARERLGEIKYMSIMAPHFLEYEAVIRAENGNDPENPQIQMIEKIRELKAMGLI